MPDLADVTKTVEGLATAWETFKQKNDERLAEIEKKGSADPVLDEQVDRINTEIGELKSKMDKIQIAGNRPKHAEKEEDSDAIRDYKKGLFRFMLTKEDAALGALFEKAKPDLQKKGMLVGSDVDGGYFVTPEISSEIIRIVRETSPMRQFASVGTTSKSEYHLFNNRNEITSGWVGEIQTRAKTTTPTYGKNKIQIHKVYAFADITEDLLEDADRDLEGEYAELVAEEFTIEENTAFVSGNGINKPRGFTTYDNGTTWGTIEQVTTAVASTISFDDLMDLIVKIKVAYRNGANFMMSRTTENHLRKKKNGAGDYLWQPSLTVGTPDSILGYPVGIAEDMAAIATNSLSVGFGNFKRGYQVADRRGIKVIRDIYTAKATGQIEVMTTKRVGGDVKDFDAIKLLKVQ